MDNFCCTNYAYHSEKICPYFINSFKAMLLPLENIGKENKGVEEDNTEDEKGEAEELKEGEHPPNLNFIWDETELDNMDVNVVKEDCVGTNYCLWNKEDHST